MQNMFYFEKKIGKLYHQWVTSKNSPSTSHELQKLFVVENQKNEL